MTQSTQLISVTLGVTTLNNFSWLRRIPGAKFKIFRASSLLAALLSASGAWGATVLYDGSTVTGINQVQINSDTYNVTFEFDTFDNFDTGSDFPFFRDSAGAFAAANEIVLILNAEAPVPGSVTSNGITPSTWFYVPYSVIGGDNLQATAGGYDVFAPDAWAWAWAGIPLDTPQSFAVFTAVHTAVPVPPAIWLFGSALGLAGWLKRRTV